VQFSRKPLSCADAIAVSRGARAGIRELVELKSPDRGRLGSELVQSFNSEGEAMSKRLIFAILATAFVFASVAEATALDRNSAARAKPRSSAATSPKKPDSAEDRLQKIMNICRCSDIPKGTY
jgi:hypothetical protein